jgi:hypothetical protein
MSRITAGNSYLIRKLNNSQTMVAGSDALRRPVECVGDTDDHQAGPGRRTRYLTERLSRATSSYQLKKRPSPERASTSE